MAPPKKPARKHFSMPPATTPAAAEPKTPDDVYTLLRDMRIELRNQKELIMKISELSSSIDRLIAAATSIKNQPVPVPEQPDDPAVEELNEKIQRAIAVLEGRDTSFTDANGRPTTDPNSGTATGFPGSADPADALATDINFRDPNAT